jgi:hypothetical protein
VAVVTAGCASSSTSSTAQSGTSSAAAAPQASGSSGGIHFPASLFGMPRNTSAGAQQLARSLTRGLANMPIFTHPQVAVYGANPDTGVFAVIISGLSASAKKYGQKPTAAGLRRGFLMMGVADAQGFPAGKGVQLACGHLRRSGTTAILCLRYDKKTVGMGMSFNGAASSLSDAAADTNQAVSASGG